MSWRVAHSLNDLAGEVNARWPERARVSDGTLGDTAHAARKSDHNPDAGGVVRARDITEWDPGTPRDESDDVAEVIAETIRRRKDPRVKYVIWRGHMFSSYATSARKAWEWGTYTGPNGHFQHVHVSVQPGATGDVAGPWGIHPTTPTPRPPVSEEELTMDTEAKQAFETLNEKVDGLIAGQLTLTAESRQRAGRIIGWLKALALKQGVTRGDADKQVPADKLWR